MAKVKKRKGARLNAKRATTRDRRQSTASRTRRSGSSSDSRKRTGVRRVPAKAGSDRGVRRRSGTSGTQSNNVRRPARKHVQPKDESVSVSRGLRTRGISDQRRRNAVDLPVTTRRPFIQVGNEAYRIIIEPAHKVDLMHYDRTKTNPRYAVHVPDFPEIEYFGAMSTNDAKLEAERRIETAIRGRANRTPASDTEGVADQIIDELQRTEDFADPPHDLGDGDVVDPGADNPPRDEDSSDRV